MATVKALGRNQGLMVAKNPFSRVCASSGDSHGLFLTKFLQCRPYLHPAPLILVREAMRRLHIPADYRKSAEKGWRNIGAVGTNQEVGFILVQTRPRSLIHHF